VRPNNGISQTSSISTKAGTSTVQVKTASEEHAPGGTKPTQVRAQYQAPQMDAQAITNA